MIYGQKCSNCGYGLDDNQIKLALDDASTVPMIDGEYDTESGEYDRMTFCCSDYTDETGCQGENDPEQMAYWYTR